MISHVLQLMTIYSMWMLIIIIIIIIMIVMHRPQKEYDEHVLISYIYKLSACDS